MLEKGHISAVQYGMVMTLIVIGTTILFAPGLSIELGGRDAWLSPLVAGLEGLIIVLTMLSLSNRFPGQTPIEYTQALLGKWVGSLLGFYILTILFRQFAFMLREFTDFTTTVTLTRTPPDIILLLMLVIIFYGVCQGLEVLARVTQVVVIIELTQLLVSVITLASKDIELEHLTPLLEQGPMPLLRSSIFIMNWFGELMIVGFLLPYIRIRKAITKVSLYSVGSVTLLLCISNLFTLGVFGDVVASRLQYGLYEVARYISVANFLERLDPIVMGVWIMLIYCKLAIFCYVTSLGVAQLFRLRDYRPVVGIVCLVGAVMSQHMFRHQADMTSFMEHTYPPYGLLVSLGGPLFLLLLAKLLKRKGVASRA
ncbi:MAG: GerAB/ArcD/ProY family transporter [Tumebacillaceae bacterium]